VKVVGFEFDPGFGFVDTPIVDSRNTRRQPLLDGLGRQADFWVAPVLRLASNGIPQKRFIIAMRMDRRMDSIEHGATLERRSTVTRTMSRLSSTSSDSSPLPSQFEPQVRTEQGCARPGFWIRWNQSSDTLRATRGTHEAQSCQPNSPGTAMSEAVRKKRSREMRKVANQQQVTTGASTAEAPAPSAPSTVDDTPVLGNHTTTTLGKYQIHPRRPVVTASTRRPSPKSSAAQPTFGRPDAVATASRLASDVATTEVVRSVQSRLLRVLASGPVAFTPWRYQS
jgi:hypothetical protein